MTDAHPDSGDAGAMSGESTRAGAVQHGETVLPLSGVPSDNTTLVEVLGALRGDGYRTSMRATDDGSLVCSNCGERTDPEQFPAQQVRRLEGASDPADEMLVVAGACERCGERAVLVLGFGPTASPADSAALSRLPLGSV